MSNILVYTLSLQDKVSNVLKKIGIQNDQMLQKFAGLEKKSKEVAQAFSGLGNNIENLRKKIELLKAERDVLPVNAIHTIRRYNTEIFKLENQVRKLETLNGSWLGNKLKQAFAGIPPILTNPVTLVGAGLGISIRKGMEAEMQKMNITTMLSGDAAAAEQLFKDITKYAVKTPYEKTTLIEAQKMMMSFGMSADESFARLKQLGDIALGDAQKMNTLSLALGKLMSTGRAQGDEINMMIEAGFNPLQIISEKTGESMESLRDRMQKGKLSAQEVATAFETATSAGGRFYKGAENASNSLGGKWSNLIDSLNVMLLKIYEAVSPVITPLVEAATYIFEKIGRGINWFITGLKTARPVVWGIVTAITALTTGLIAYRSAIMLTTLAKTRLTLAVWKSNLAFLFSPVGWITASIVVLIAVIGYLILKFKNWGSVWTKLMNLLKASWDVFKYSFIISWLWVQDKFLSGIEIMKKGWYKLKSLWDKKGAEEGLEVLKKESEERKREMEEVKMNLSESAKQVQGNVNIFSGLEKNNKSLKDVINETKEKLGVSPKKNITNAAEQIGLLHPKEKLSSTEKNKKSAMANNIVTGGTKNTVIHIRFNNMVERMMIQSATGRFSEAAADIKEQVAEVLTRLLAGAAATAG
ncbi:MAG: tape measure protein [Chitinophagaceae bacterium]|nr:tape measure protein [Chitinophagaceae bacterium]